MKTENYDSKILGHKIEYSVHGSSGTVVLLLPPAHVKPSHWDEKGAIEQLSGLLDQGKLKVYALDSYASKTWDDHQEKVPGRISRLEKFYSFILDEFIPKVMKAKGKIVIAGIDRGATDASNLFFGYPKFFKGLVSISGLYKASHFFGPYMNKEVFRNSLIDALEDIQDEEVLRQYADADIIFSAGSHEHSRPSLEDTMAVVQLLKDKNIPVLADYWGEDVTPSWDWWNKQLPYFLAKVA
ncbi:MAG: hypothetical protein FWF01_03380 [Alphaproteobacteria bacterium]|nr:hypothetical protein [Alphaproteobacteria bacterium]